MYRAVTCEVLARGVDPHDAPAVAGVARAAVVATRPRVSVNGRDVEDLIRTDAEVNEAVSVVAANAEVRSSMVERQRAWADAEPVGTVVEGRDITTVVFPDATLKVYLTASLEERAARRADESPESVARRDEVDATREASPLTVADGALVVDTTGRAVEDVVEEIYRMPDEPIELNPRRTPFYRFARGLVGGLGRLLFRPTVLGRENIPATGPVIIAPTHRSNVDFAFTIYMTRRKVFFMAKDQLFRVPVFGTVLRHLGVFPVDRDATDRTSMRLAEAVLDRGEALLLFPEGTRKFGLAVEPINDGAMFIASRADAPVVPVADRGQRRARCPTAPR